MAEWLLEALKITMLASMLILTVFVTISLVTPGFATLYRVVIRELKKDK